MNGDEAFAAFDELKQGLFLFRGNCGDVGVDDQSIVKSERFGVQIGHLIRVCQLNVPFRQYRPKLREPLAWLMMAVVAEEEDLDRFRLLCRFQRQSNQ